MYTEREIKTAKKRVLAKKAFFLHAAIYAIIITLLFILNVLTFHEEHVWWFLFPAAGWGAGLAIHFVVVFGFISTGLFGKDWEEKAVDIELRKMDKNRTYPPSLSSKEPMEIDPDKHLQLKELQKDYDENDLV